MWDLPGARIEPTSPALAGRFLTIGPPEKFLKLGFDIVSSFLAAPGRPHMSALLPLQLLRDVVPAAPAPAGPPSGICVQDPRPVGAA